MQYFKISIPILLVAAGTVMAIFSSIFLGIFLAVVGLATSYEVFVPRGMNAKQWAGVLFIALAGFLHIAQVLHGWFDGILTSTTASIQFGFILILLYGLGLGLVFNALGDNFKWWLIGAASILIMTMIISSVMWGLDAVGLTSSGAGTYVIPVFWGLESLTRIATDVALIINIVTGLIPAIVLLVGIFTWYSADTGDEHQTALIEVVVAGGILLVFVFAFSAIGFNIFG